MGVVFLAEQVQPVRRKVAFKLIKPGMDSSHVIARFEAERQALAMLDHPNIARVVDAGTTDSGRPYFVMDLIKGIPITQYCDDAKLGLRERLELFLPVCEAIQHAHQKGIIHRDLKPSNIMVTILDGKPVPKIIDFGVAKATDQRLTERTLFTEFGAIIGTPEYMSPEQADLSGLDIDTRSDIFSLGVLLYELLTGTTPLERPKLHEAGYAEVLRQIKEEEPPKPSTRLSHSGDRIASIAATRSTEPIRLTKMLRGELDWIVMKTLEKDRGRRYETANGVVRDIQRYLDGDPVEAGPPSASYKLRKLARKHRPALVTATAFALLLMSATAVSVWQAIRATRAERAAQAESSRAIAAEKAAKDQRDRAAKAELTAQAERDAAETARQLAQLASDEIINIYKNIGDRARSFFGEGRYSQAEPLLTQVLDGYRRVFEDRHQATASAMTTLHCCSMLSTGIARRGRITSTALSIRESLYPKSSFPNGHPELASSLNSLGELRQDQGSDADARLYFERSGGDARAAIPGGPLPKWPS